MSIQITTSFVEQYSSNVAMLSQQMGSKLRTSVDVENITGKNSFFDQVGVTAAQIRTSRHGDTPQIDTPHSRRRLSLADYEWADLVDDVDKVRMLVDPTSSYETYVKYINLRRKTLHSIVGFVKMTSNLNVHQGLLQSLM